MKTAIITGATGQDGAYLAQLLLGKGYEVYATHRRSSSTNFWRMDYLGVTSHERLHIVQHEPADVAAGIRLIERARPVEIYNLAAQTFVAASFEQPAATTEINCFGTLALLEAIRTTNRSIRFYQASSAEMFGKVQAVPQNEKTPFYPRSPYGVSKLYSHWMTINYREAYDIFGCSGILFNHESPLRGREFVTRKISEAVARIKLGDPAPCRLGNLDARRDWGYSKDYVEGMWRMLQADTADDYVLATSRTETVREFATMAFMAAGMDLIWRGTGLAETAVLKHGGAVVVEVDPHHYRPSDVDLLIGDSSKARRHLGWSASTTLEDICKMMVDADIERAATPKPLGQTAKLRFAVC